MVRVRGALALCLALAGCDDVFHLRHVPELPDAPAVDLHPAAYYDFEENVADTGVLRDRTLHGHDGICSTAACPSAVQGAPGHGLAGAFDGTQYVTVPQFAMTAFTVTFWVRADDRVGTMCPVNRVFGSVSSDSWQLCLEVDANDVATLHFYTAVVSSIESNQPMPLGTWHQIGMRWDGALLAIFFDRHAVALGPGTTEFDTGAIVLGSDINDTTLVSPLIGALDDVAIYDRALTDSEIMLTP